MLIPKRTKYRKQFRGRMKGKEHRGNTVTYGEFGLVATEPSWITSRQIEAARIAMTRYTKRGGKVWIKILCSKWAASRWKLQRKQCALQATNCRSRQNF